MLRPIAIAVGLLAGMPVELSAQTLTPTAEVGRALIYQHCGVCHTKPDLNAAQFGPSLNKTLLGAASAADIRKVIAAGAPDMPGFSLTLSSAQIDEIVDYIQQASPAPTFHAPAAPAGSPATPSRGDD